MSKDDIKPGEQLTLAQINRIRKQAAQQAADLASEPVASEVDPHKLNVPELKKWLADQGIEFEADLKKPDLQALIPASEPVASEVGKQDETED